MLKDEDWHEVMLAHARRPAFKRKLEQSLMCVEDALNRPINWYVGVSGGKDSTVVLDLVRSLRPDIPATFSDDEWWLPETEAYLKRLIASGVALNWIRTSVSHTDWFKVEGDWRELPGWAAAHGYDGVVMGLRAEESKGRRHHLRTRGLLNQTKAGEWHCNPIGWWTWQDVWAYIASHDLDYNHAYDRLREIGVEPEHARIGPFAVDRVLGYGQLAILKRGWPELFYRFAAEHPEARAYV